MITLRSYTNPIDAGMAKSLLEARGIICELADENANEYGGAPLAMPIRLLVADEQLDEAREILRSTANAQSDTVGPSNDMIADVRTELTKIRDAVKMNTTVVIMLCFASALYVLIRLGSSSQTASATTQQDSWSAARAAMDRMDYDKAIIIAQRLKHAHPDSYYPYYYLGYAELERGHFEEAERYFQRAYELLPTEEHLHLVEAVRRRLAEKK